MRGFIIHMLGIIAQTYAESHRQNYQTGVHCSEVLWFALSQIDVTQIDLVNYAQDD